MRALYTLLWHLALPLVPLRLWWRGRREPGYREHVGERFGRYDSAAPAPPVIWIHAVSLGETRATVPLIERIVDTYPRATILLTHMTATGRAAGAAAHDDRVVQAWLPYDVPFAVRAFFRHFKPAIGMLIETELWPNLVRGARANGVPMYLVNARLSPRSAGRYQRVRAIARELLASLDGVAAQTNDDAARLVDLGATEPIVTGNIKFDIAVPDAARGLGRSLRERFGATRPVWLAASTREGEETLLLDAIARRALPPRTLTLIVPRHPQRFDAVAGLLRSRALAFVRRSDDAPVAEDVDYVVGDTLGEMAAYCEAADVVFVGGSLLPLGGQNLIEPIAVGRPTLVGPHTFNFSDATQRAIAAGAAQRVADADELIASVAAFLDDGAARAAMRDAALAFHAAHGGALDRLWSWLAPRIDAALAAGARSSPALGRGE